VYHGWLVDLLTHWRDLRRCTAGPGAGADEADDEEADASEANHPRHGRVPAANAAAATSSEAAQVETVMARCLLRLGDLGASRVRDVPQPTPWTLTRCRE